MLQDLRNYEQENRWLNSPYNKTIAYIPDKCITVNEDGEHSFYYITDIEFFVYGMDMDSEFLRPIHELDENERKTLEQIQHLNTQLEPLGLNAVFLRKEFNVDFVTFCHKQNTDSYYVVKIEDLPKITSSVVDVLLSYKQEMSIQKPYAIRFDNGMVSVNGETRFYM